MPGCRVSDANVRFSAELWLVYLPGVSLPNRAYVANSQCRDGHSPSFSGVSNDSRTGHAGAWDAERKQDQTATEGHQGQCPEGGRPGCGVRCGLGRTVMWRMGVHTELAAIRPILVLRGGGPGETEQWSRLPYGWLGAIVLSALWLTGKMLEARGGSTTRWASIRICVVLPDQRVAFCRLWARTGPVSQVHYGTGLR
jgi:hypothetical protein